MYKNNLGLSEIWLNQNFYNERWFKLKIKQVLRDQFIQKWRAELSEMTYCDVYIEFKEKFCLEPYLKTDKIDKKSKLFI